MKKTLSKKIVMMYDFFSEHGGVERIMLFQANALRKEGYNVSFAFAYVDEDLKKERLSDFKVVEYGRLPKKNETLQICSSLLRKSAINKLKDVDLIICHSFPASYVAFKVKKRFNIPYLLHLHHPPQFLYNVNKDWADNSHKRKFAFLTGAILRKPLRKFDNYCVKNADGYLVECETVKRIILDTYRINGTVIYPTLGKQFKIIDFKPNEIKKYNITKKYILGSGRIIKQKRFDYLIRAFSLLKNQDLQLVLAGKCDKLEKERLKEIASKLNVKVLFLGPLPFKELVKIYNSAQVTVLTCPNEWFGLVPIESSACGCPVVAWKDNFGPEETIIEDKNGYLAEPYNVKSLAKEINKSLKKKWNKKIISETVQKFNEETQSKNLIKAVKKVKF